MSVHVCVDFGSTYTKVTAIDVTHERWLGNATALTTVHTNVLEGLNKALEKLKPSLEGAGDITGFSACSSAAGGLKMAAIGLVEELTVEAAKRACLGAGALVTHVFSHHLSRKDIEAIRTSPIDIILLAGGTDGGNSECILYNAQKLAQARLNIPIIVAGNKDANETIETFFVDQEDQLFIVDNVMPALRKLNVAEAKKVIRQLFMTKIVEAKGIRKAEAMIGEIIMPTPEAVLIAAELLAKGTDTEAGIGECMVIDIGGATTDVHTIGEGYPKRAEVVMKGLQEPFAKRTVEGDLGMRYSAQAMLSLVSERHFKERYQFNGDVHAAAQKRTQNVSFLADTEEEQAFDQALAKLCTDVSMSRHVGHVEVVHTPLGAMYYQLGKDLSDLQTVIGTGGVLIHHPNAKEILKEATEKSDRKLELRPSNPTVLIDQDYLLSAMGLLSQKHPDLALKLMKRHLV